ncbi:MAG: hypothetical protein HY316_04465 [Acidobacteria bacterium]|nr:hypothetical protein [Acidobacteriota bacterium]
MAVDRALIRSRAEATGLTIPEDRLDAVLRQYEGFLRIVEEIDKLPIGRETEPVLEFSLDSFIPSTGTGSSGDRR